MKITLKICTSVAAIAAAIPLSQAAAQTDADSVSDQIIVTTERREQGIQDVAGTVQALSGDDLLRDGIGSEFRNLQTSVAGLNISNQEGNLEIFIRGVGSANNTELGDPAVAPHINGVYIPRPRGFGTQFFDIERVEVHKGPQGTLRGRNAVGGTINIITAKPKLGEVEGYIQGQYGSHNHRSFEGALNIPLGETAAIRIAGFSENHDSYFSNAAPTNNRPAGIEDEVAGRFSLLWEPNEFLTVDFIADYTKEGGTGYPGAQMFEAFSNGNLYEDLDPRAVVYRGPEGELDNEVYGFTNIINYDFGGIGVEVLNSFRSVDFFQLSGNTDGTAYPGRDLSNPSDFDDFGAVYFRTISDSRVHEIRLFSTDDSPLQWALGGFHMNEEQEVGFFSVNDSGLFFSGVEFASPDVDVRSTAAYFDAVYEVNDRFRVKGGIRYTSEFKSRFGIGGNWTLGLGSDGFGCCFVTRLGTEGFTPLLNARPNFIAPTNNAEAAQFLLEGAAPFGARDTIQQQLGGIINGTRPNGSCIDTPDTQPGYLVTCPANGQHSFFVLGAPAQQEGEISEDFFDWRAGLEYDVNDDSLLYATVSTGTKASGFNDNITPETAPPFDSEKLLAFEVGSKNVFNLGGERLVLNGSVYYYDYDDIVQQSLIQVGGTTGIGSGGFSQLNANVAEARVIGVEFDSSLTLPHGFLFSLTGSYTDSKVQSGVLADVRGQDFGVNDATDADGDGCTNVCQIDLTGNELPLVSKFQFIGKLQQRFEAFGGEMDWQVLANYRSDYYLSIYNHSPVARPIASGIDCGGAATDPIACGFEAEQAGFFTVNVGVGYTSGDGRWRAEAYGTNLLNVDATQKALLGNSLNLRFLNLPRTGGVRLRVNL